MHLSAIQADGGFLSRKINMALQVGDKAPDFSLATDTNSNIALSEFAGKKVVLYFYPKDNTPGCTLEAKDFRDCAMEIAAKNALVVGVSKDSVGTHNKFKTKHNLNFTLLSDPTGEVCELYNVFKEKSLFGKTALGIERSTFIIDENGVISKIWRKVKVKGHAQEVLASL